MSLKSLKRTLTFLSGIVGVMASIFWTENILTPLYSHPHNMENLTGEFLVIQILLFISFSSIFYFLFLDAGDILKKKQFAILGTILPLVYTCLFLLEESFLTEHRYSDIWMIIGGGLGITIILSFFALVCIDEFLSYGKSENEEETDVSLSIPPSTPFYASEALTLHVHNVMNSIEKAKTLELDVETLHQIEKMETQLEESKLIYNRISTSYLEKAENMLKEIVVKMEVKLVQLFEQYNEGELKKLEKILLQQ